LFPITRRRAALLLVLIVAFAAGLRLWNHDFDPLESSKPLYHDGWAKFVMANRVAQGEFRPEHYKQPAFLIYTSGLLLRASAFLGYTDGEFLWRLIVLYMVACSVATVGVTYCIAGTVFERRGPALLAAAFAAAAPASVIGSRYIKEDVPLALMVNLSVLFLALLLKTRKLYWYVPAGVFVGLAIATKYSAAGMVLVLVAVHCFVVLRGERGARLRTAASPWFLGGLVSVPLLFLLVNPYIIPDWALFHRTLSDQIAYAAQGHNDGTAVRGCQYCWMFYVTHALLPGMTLPLFTASMIGAMWAASRRERVAVFLLAWVVFFYLNLENSPAKPFPFFVRYVHSLFPALCIFAALLFGRLLDSCGSRRSGRYMVTVAAAGCLLVPLLTSALVTSGTKHDTRMAATEWINANLEEGATVYLDDVFYSPRPDPERFVVDYRKRMYHASLETLRKRKVDYVVLNSFRTERYRACRAFSGEASRIYDYYVQLEQTGRLVREFAPRFRCQEYGFHNPVIKVYRLPWAGKGNHEL